MKIFINPKPEKWEELLRRPYTTTTEIENNVQIIFNEVQHKGDIAVKKYTSFFDKVKLDRLDLSLQEADELSTKLSPELKKAILQAYTNIYKFHKAQEAKPFVVETQPGITCWLEKKPIAKVGLYIPGGSAPLFSTVLMLGVPAQLAGCQEIVLCTPPNQNKSIHPAIQFAAKLCGITRIVKVGGIQAIAALTFGTETIPKVYKIFGPGNQFVTQAKLKAFQNGIAIDMPAGPSELMIVADNTANSSFVAADLLSQAEHGPDSQTLLVSNSNDFIQEVKNEINRQLASLNRTNIIRKALQHTKFIYLESPQASLNLINVYAPEHLIIARKDKAFFKEGVQNAGSVFLGNYSPESVGDYATGTNHTLPTNGFAKQYSGVCLDSFLKSTSFQELSSEGLQNIGNTVELMAQAEGLEAHKNAVSIRLNKLKS